MSWNYRVVHTNHTTPAGRTEQMFAIHEVYYGKNDELLAYTKEPAWPAGETPEQFLRDFERFQKALTRPVLEEQEFAVSLAASEIVRKEMQRTVLTVKEITEEESSGD